MSYLATAVPLVSLAMAATAPFVLFRRLPSSSSAFSSSYAAAETHTGSRSGGPMGAGAGAAGEWSGPMLPAEVNRFARLFFFLLSWDDGILVTMRSSYVGVFFR